MFLRWARRDIFRLQSLLITQPHLVLCPSSSPTKKARDNATGLRIPHRSHVDRFSLALSLLELQVIASDVPMRNLPSVQLPDAQAKAVHIIVHSRRRRVPSRLLGPLEPVWRLKMPGRSPIPDALVLVDIPPLSKVTKPNQALVVEKHVLQLHIAVDYTFCVQPLHDANHLVQDATALRGRHGPGRGKGSREIHHEAVEEEVPDFRLGDPPPTNRDGAVPGGRLKLVFSKFTPGLEHLGGLPFDPVDHGAARDGKLGHFDV